MDKSVGLQGYVENMPEDESSARATDSNNNLNLSGQYSE